MTAVLVFLALVIAAVVVLAASSVRVLREYERGVVFRFGRLLPQRGPGLTFLIPIVDRMTRISLRTVTLKIPAQDVITRDNVPARVTAVAYFRILDARRAVVEVEDFLAATLQIAQTTLRSILGKVELDSLLAERERLNEDLQQVVDEQTEPWGIKVTTVEIKDVEIPENMQRAIARQAEAERERRAKVINAEGEFQASAKLLDAADVISRNPTALQLRYLQTLLELGSESNSNSTIVFPLPIDLIRPMLGAGANGSGGADRIGLAGELERAARQAPDAALERAPAGEAQLPLRDAGGQIPRDEDDSVAAVGAPPRVALEPDRAEHAATASRNQER